MKTRPVKLAAITSWLDWALRHACSKDQFDMAVAQRHIEQHTEKNLALMEEAARRGADVVVGPEYFRASELFLTTPENKWALAEPLDGPTAGRLAALAKKFSLYVGAAYHIRHNNAVAEIGVLFGRNGEFVGMRVKDEPEPPRVFETDFGKVGIQVCSDFQKPRNALALGEGGANVVLLSGCGFMGPFAEAFVVVRALDHQTAVVYADSGQAMIVLPNGNIPARTSNPNTVILTDVDLSKPVKP
ncbi:MAG: carbon-nitrogen hydrolase family protein [Lentisphaerae bacterium]|nr:carbon-nitrogen hydrolase family protein [Lentisphaerota bacterium]